MEKEVLQTAFDDVFEHLGVEVLLQQGPTTSLYVTALIKEPESVYEVGGSQVIGQVAEFSIRAADATPKVGNFFLLGLRKYKIYEEPLLDASNLIWKFRAILVEK
jgi:hypothetical protein